MKHEGGSFFRQRGEEFGLAMGLLTRFPLPGFKTRSAATLASAFWAYPLAGALIGGLSAGAFWLSLSAGFSTIACVLIATAVAVLSSGGFHEDGLTDFWDGIGGGRTREAKLAIMRDSRIGSYGALALFMTLGLQVSFLVSLQHYAGAAFVMAGIVAAETAARGTIALPAVSLTPAHQDGMGNSMARLSAGVCAAGLSFAIIIPMILLGVKAMPLIGGALLGVGLITILTWRFLGGYTGDVFGASVATARMTALGAFVLVVTP
ncbi:MAG: adenosylcobinamide-GDP ribazoletransferase [Rhodomicrobium sp.]|nr:adenosylcobinamide-GDP ribazoletransferase [Rhodomicrobium sp.]